MHILKIVWQRVGPSVFLLLVWHLLLKSVIHQHSCISVELNLLLHSNLCTCTQDWMAFCWLFRACGSQPVLWKQLPASHPQCDTAKKAMSNIIVSAAKIRLNQGRTVRIRSNSRTHHRRSSSARAFVSTLTNYEHQTRFSAKSTTSVEPRFLTLPNSVCFYDLLQHVDVSEHFPSPNNINNPSALVYTDMRDRVLSVIRPQIEPDIDVTPSINPNPSVPDPNLPTPASDPTPVTFPEFRPDTSPSEVPSPSSPGTEVPEVPTESPTPSPIPEFVPQKGPDFPVPSPAEVPSSRPSENPVPSIPIELPSPSPSPAFTPSPSEFPSPSQAPPEFSPRMTMAMAVAVADGVPRGPPISPPNVAPILPPGLYITMDRMHSWT